MPRLSLDKARVIGQIQARVHQKDVALLFGVSSGCISKLKSKYRMAGDVKWTP